MQIGDDSVVRESLQKAYSFAVEPLARKFWDELLALPEMTPIEQIMYLELYPISKNRRVKVRPQAKIGPYRVDFLISCGDIRMIVECDGHDFHEKTKEQAAKDKKRDRWFQSNGFKVMRFTGSELWRDPWACADEIIDWATRSFG